MDSNTTGFLGNQESAFEKVYNFRDVGETINNQVSDIGRGRIVREKMFYRSGRLDDATPGDRRKLIQDFGIKTVIDLRTKSEHIKQSQRLASTNRYTTAAEVTTNTDSLSISGIHTVRINFISRRFEIALLRQLGWLDLIKFFALMIFQFRMAAIGILGSKVLKKKGLTGMCYDSLEFCGEEIRESLEVLSDPSSYPVLLHCTQGKDRTGLLCILVLLLLDAPVHAIKHDYTSSWEGLAPVREQMLVEIEEIGLDENYAMTPEGLVGDVKVFLDERWGGVEKYLDGIGIGDEVRKGIVGNLKA